MSEGDMPAGRTSPTDLDTVPAMVRALLKRLRAAVGPAASRDLASQAESRAAAPTRKTRSRLFIKYVFAQAFELDEPGWKKLTIRWGLFFLCLAVINESVWRSTSTATWVSFKVWGIIPLIFLFALAQTPLVIKHQTNADGGKKAQE